MQKRKLGNSDLHITPLGLGTWAHGASDTGFNWGPQDDEQSIAAIEAAVESGINWADTAPIYGWGHSEEVLGRALKRIGSARRPFVFTKCSLVWDDKQNVRVSVTAESVRRELEASLRRLQVETIDLYQIHRPAEAHAENEDGWRALAEAQQAGKVRWIGVSNFTVEQMERIGQIAPITSLQPPYSALMRGIEQELLPYCQRNGIGVIAYSPLHSGLLSGSMTRARFGALPENDWRKQFSPAFKEPYFTQALAFAEWLREFAAARERSIREVALAWALHHPAVTGVIVGARSREQLQGVIGAMDFRLSDAEYAEIGAKLPESVEFL